MLGRLIAAFLKRRLVERTPEPVQREDGGLYWESHHGQDGYCIRGRRNRAQSAGSPPVPPPELWLGYGPDADTYLSGGRKNVADMVRILAEGGVAVADARRVLELGCGAGRMIRHLPEIVPGAELWGVDVSAPHVRWAIDHLSPAVRFAVTTLVPHLPFGDGSFDLIFCGSVFTHIEDLQEAWLLELGRVLRPGGALYLTIHDEHTVALFDGAYRDCPLARRLSTDPLYQSAKHDFDMIAIGRRTESQVFYRSDYFRALVPPLFRWVSLTREAYWHQSAVVLVRQET